MKLLIIIIALLQGIRLNGTIVSQVYEGYGRTDDIYIVDVNGIKFPVISDDFNAGEHCEIFVNEDGIHCWYTE